MANKPLPNPITVWSAPLCSRFVTETRRVCWAVREAARHPDPGPGLARDPTPRAVPTLGNIRDSTDNR